MWILRLRDLYTSIRVIVKTFGDSLSGDLDIIWGDIETALATKSWADIWVTINAAENLYLDFIKTYSGNQVEVQAFLQALKTLFTK